MTFYGAFTPQPPGGAVRVVIGKPRIPSLEKRPKRAIERPGSGLQE